MDVTYEVKDSAGGQCFNYRVAGIWEVEGKVLVCQLAGQGFYFLPGGRVKLGETAQEALAREFDEELGLEIEQGPLVFVVENFFRHNATLFHELGFFFRVGKGLNLAAMPADGETRGNLTFFWRTPEELATLNLQPEFLRARLMKLPKEVVHLVNRGESLV